MAAAASSSSSSSYPKLLVADIASQVTSVPSSYIRPVSDRPNLFDEEDSGSPIPLINLQDIDGPNRSQVVEEIGSACQSDGFFQIKNHGVPKALIDAMLQVSREFFNLPESERLKHYSSDPSKTTRLSTSFNVSTERVRNWRDYLRLHCYPPEDFIHEWPSNPPHFRDIVGEYSKKVRELALVLLGAISESLGLEKDYMEKALEKHAQHMAINYYPRCPQPELTYGLPGHKDPNAITILLQDEVSGLQVLRNGNWVTVNPLPNTFIINVGDQIQVLSNDRYKSVLHRAVVNSCSERISVPTFYCPSPDAVIKPPEALVDEQHPSMHGSFSYAEYYDKFWRQGLQSASCLDLFKPHQTME